MFTGKRIVKTIGVAAISFMVSFTFPTGESYAASSTQSSGVVGSWVNQLFQKVWQQANKTRTQPPTTPQPSPNNPENSGNKNKPGNPRSDENTGGKEEQSNVSLADKIIQTGEKYLGTPYQYGAKSGQTRTFDCSSFTQYVYKQHGISLPRNSRQQAQVGTTIPRSQIKKGDLLFFTTSKSNGQIGHVAIYAGNNRVLHTWGPGGVRYDSLSTGWLNKGYVTAKRVIK